MVQSNILVAYILEHVAGKFLAFEALCVDEVTEIASCATCGAMKVFARNCSVVAWFDELVWIWRWVKCQLLEFLLVCLLKLSDSIIGECNELVVVY